MKVFPQSIILCCNNFSIYGSYIAIATEQS